MELIGQIQNGGSLNGSFGYDSGDYELLSHKPQINGVTLIGNKTSADLHIEGGGTDDYNDLDNKPMINGVQLSGNLTPEDLGLAEIIYPDDPNLYLNGSGEFTEPDYFSGDYDDLTDKPQINGVTLSGDKSTSDLLIDYDDLSGRPQINGSTLTGNQTAEDLGLEPEINYPGDATQYLNGEGNFTTPDYFSGDYDDLTDKPQINGVTLSGDKSTSDLLLDYEGLSNHPEINGIELTGNKSGNDLKLTSGEIFSGSGSSVNFNSTGDLKLIKCKVDFIEDQSGSGTPAPDNPRPISGRNSITINISPTSDPLEGTNIIIYLGDIYYRGSLNVKTGELIIYYVLLELDGSNDEGWFKSGLTACDIFGYNNSNYVFSDDDIVLNEFNYVNITNYNQIGYAWYDSGGSQLRVGYTEYNTTDLATFRTWLSNNPIQVIAKLPTPAEYQIDPTTIQTLLGDNYISTEDGTISIESPTQVYDPIIKYLINNL